MRRSQLCRDGMRIATLLFLVGEQLKTTSKPYPRARRSHFGVENEVHPACPAHTGMRGIRDQPAYVVPVRNEPSVCHGCSADRLGVHAPGSAVIREWGTCLAFLSIQHRRDAESDFGSDFGWDL